MRHQDFDQTFAQGPRSGVKAGFRPEQLISTGEASARRGARRGIYPITKKQGSSAHGFSYFYLVCTKDIGSVKYIVATVNCSSAPFATSCTRAGRADVVVVLL